MVFYMFLFVISAAVFVALISFVFPKLFLDTGCYTDSEGDRGLQKFKGEDFLAVSYMPQEKFREVVEQYVIEDKKGEKTVKCKLTGDFKYIDYDIVAYSHDKKIIDVIKVKEIISEKGFTKATKIPYEANYVTIWVNETEKGKVSEPLSFGAPKGKKKTFFFFSAVSVIAESFFVKLCFAHLFGGVFCESFLSSKSLLVSLIIIAVLVAATLPFMNYVINRRSKR